MDVDFVINCYERTYRDVLSVGFVDEIASQQRFPFADVTVLVNNVDDRSNAERMAAELLSAHSPVTRVRFVADHLDAALHVTGLSRRHLKHLPHFTDCCLVAVTLDGPDNLVYWDADAVLRDPHDWITPSLEFMRAHPEVSVANPDNWHEGLAVREALHIDGGFAVGYGFSDVAWLARRSELARPIYRYFSPASWRYPTAYAEPIFEQRVDAYMRRRRRLRATYLGAVVDHPAPAGLNYPASTLRSRVRRKAFRHVGSIAARVSGHPAIRAWPDVS